MPKEIPNPDEFNIPTTEEIDEMRRYCEITKSAFSTRVGRSTTWWTNVMRYDSSPRVRDVHECLRVIQDDWEEKANE